MVTNGKQIGSLVVTNHHLLKLVREIIWDKETETLVAVAISRLGGQQEYIHFLEPGSDEGKPRESCKTATDVDGEDCRCFIQAVEDESGQSFSPMPMYLSVKGGRKQKTTTRDEGVLVWHSTEPEPEPTGLTPPPVALRTDSE